MRIDEKPLHGGNLRYASDKFKNVENSFIDFSASINPLGVPQLIKRALYDAVNDGVEKYPDPESLVLVAALAEYHGVDTNCVLPGNGASEILDIALRAFITDLRRPPRVLIIAPSFSGYAAVAKGCEVTTFQLSEEDEFAIDVDRLDEALRRAEQPYDVLMLGNPNNPTSSMIEPDKLLEMLKPHMEAGLFVIVDEAFIELTLGGERNSLLNSIKKETANQPNGLPNGLTNGLTNGLSNVLPKCDASSFHDWHHNLLIVRALTKSYSLPGVRLGYGISSAWRLGKMRSVQVEWSVNAFAQSVGSVFLRLDDYRKETAVWAETEIPFMYEALREIPGFKVFKPSANFILMKITNEKLDRDVYSADAKFDRDVYSANAKLGRDELEGSIFDADALSTELALNYNILIRDASNFQGLDERFFRVAVRNREENLLLINALKTVK